ncbi:hypothetical protein [Streptomyces griseosporeus]|uniref:hypothetical protein n=1 Tax=Streptomyces griseosporeus TaxID=1910 RepID=UPI0036F691FA
MTTLLESRYRAVLRLLPAYYRREREEEMVEVYLWDVDRETQDQSRPTFGEVASIAALALRTRLGAAGAPRRYALLGAAVRHFALFAVLLQAAAAVVDRALEVTWAATHGWDMFLSAFTGRGPVPVGVAVAQWVLPLLWTVGWFALFHERRGLARVCVLAAALPTLWPVVAPLMTDALPPDPAYATASLVLAWLSALGLCAAFHRDAPVAVLPVGTPGLGCLACCVVMGASVVLVPTSADAVWAPATGFLACALGRLLWRARSPRQGGAGTLALAFLGLLVLALRVAALVPWLDVSVPGVVVAGFVGQAVAVALLTLALAVVGGRELAAR